MVVKARLNSAPGDPDVGMVDVMLCVVCPQELLVLVHAEGDYLVDALEEKCHAFSSWDVSHKSEVIPTRSLTQMRMKVQELAQTAKQQQARSCTPKR